MSSLPPSSVWLHLVSHWSYNFLSVLYSSFRRFTFLSLTYSYTSVLPKANNKNTKNKKLLSTGSVQTSDDSDEMNFFSLFKRTLFLILVFYFWNSFSLLCRRFLVLLPNQKQSSPLQTWENCPPILLYILYIEENDFQTNEPSHFYPRIGN